MATLDRKSLLAPIEGDNPAGEDLRYDPAYDQIQELRREEDADAPQGIWETSVKRADWPRVKSEIGTLLATRTKDLQLTVWLVEAMIITEGMRGLANGLVLLADLVERFWPYLYPALEDGDAEARLMPLYWLDDKIVQRVAMTPMTRDVPNEEHDFTWQTLIAAQKLEPLAAAKPRDYQKAIDEGAISVARFHAGVRATTDPFFKQLSKDLGAARAGLERLRKVLDDQAQGEAPSLSKLQAILEEIDNFTDRTMSDRGLNVVAKPTPPADGQASPGPGKALTPSKQRPGGPVPGRDRGIGSRQEAYELLTLAANYLIETEPHSPTPYLVQRAVSWGNMPLHVLLNELIEDDSDKRKLFKLLNMPTGDY